MFGLKLKMIISSVYGLSLLLLVGFIASHQLERQETVCGVLVSVDTVTEDAWPLVGNDVHSIVSLMSRQGIRIEGYPTANLRRGESYIFTFSVDPDKKRRMTKATQSICS